MRCVCVCVRARGWGVDATRVPADATSGKRVAGRARGEGQSSARMMARGRAREDARGCERRGIGGNEMFASIGGVVARRGRARRARGRGVRWEK